MSGELILNVKRERPFKCIAFQGILHLHLSNSTIAISTHYNKIYYGLLDGEFTK